VRVWDWQFVCGAATNELPIPYSSSATKSGVALVSSKTGLASALRPCSQDREKRVLLRSRHLAELAYHANVRKTRFLIELPCLFLGIPPGGRGASVEFRRNNFALTNDLVPIFCVLELLGK